MSLKSLWLYILVVLFLCLEIAIQVSPTAMASQLMHDLHINSFDLGLSSGVYFFSYALMQIPAGALLDKYNVRPIIAIALMTCLIGTVLFSLSNSVYALALARLLIGAGSAFAFIAVLVIIAELFSAKYFSNLTALTQVFASIGAVGGTFLIHMFVKMYGWRSMMLAIAAIGFLLLIAISSLLKYQKKFTVQETKYSLKQALKTIVYKRQNQWIALYSCLMWAPMTGFASLWSVSFLKTVHELTSQQAAMFSSLLWIGLAASGPIIGLSSEYFKTRKRLLAILPLIGFIAFGLLLNRIVSGWLIIPMLLLMGGACSAQVLSFTAIKESNPIQLKATAIAVNNMAVVLSGALFQPLVGFILYRLAGQNFLAHHFKIALLPILLCYFFAGVIALCCIQETFAQPKSLHSS